MGMYDNRAYEVGKGKPPKQHRFKKGQSGNPRGPSRKLKLDNLSFQELLAEFINELVPVTVNGRVVMMPKKHAIVIGVIHDGMTGTPSQRLKAFHALNELGAFDLSPRQQYKSNQEQEAAYIEFVEVLAKEAEEDMRKRGVDDPVFFAECERRRELAFSSPKS